MKGATPMFSIPIPSWFLRGWPILARRAAALICFAALLFLLAMGLGALGI